MDIMNLIVEGIDRMASQETSLGFGVFVGLKEASLIDMSRLSGLSAETLVDSEGKRNCLVISGDNHREITISDVRDYSVNQDDETGIVRNMTIRAGQNVGGEHLIVVDISNLFYVN